MGKNVKRQWTISINGVEAYGKNIPESFDNYLKKKLMIDSKEKKDVMREVNKWKKILGG